MVPFFVVGGVAVVIGLCSLWRRHLLHHGEVQPAGIVYMDESVLNAFLLEDHDRRDATAKAKAKAAKAKAARSHSEPDQIGPEDAALERFVASEHGGGTVVAGPPVDLADEGWAPDPNGEHEWRYFDSSGWSDFVLDGDEVNNDPLTPIDDASSDRAADGVTEDVADRDIDTDDDRASEADPLSASV